MEGCGDAGYQRHDGLSVPNNYRGLRGVGLQDSERSLGAVETAVQRGAWVKRSRARC